MWHSVLACAESKLRSWPPTVLVRRCHSTDVLHESAEASNKNGGRERSLARVASRRRVA